MLCAIPCMADAPHDYDVNNDYIIDSADAWIVMENLGTYNYWHYCDFNRNFTIWRDDVFSVLKAKGTTMPVVPYTDIMYVDDYEIYKVNQDTVMDWVYNWNQVDKHKYRSSDKDNYYYCWHFTRDTALSFEEDMGYRGIYRITDHAIAHAYNAIFIGDDPLDKQDWIFIDPQTDSIRTTPHYFHIRIDGINIHIAWEYGEQYGTFEYV